MNNRNSGLDKTHDDPLYKLLEAIQARTDFGHNIEKFEIVETHISYILLTGHYAYKFKKHLKLAFLDFSTLKRRKRYCEEEIRLNSRTAPELYVGVVAITGPWDLPVIDGDAEVLEYAVKMIQFPKGAELNYLLDEGRLSSRHIDNLARQIASFHLSATIIPLYHPSGSALRIESQSEANFFYIQNFLKENPDNYEKLEHIHLWTRSRFAELNWQFITRKHQGYIRDCHGDLHLRNIILLNDKLRVFDCLEFSDELRQIDVISDIAFLLMDLEARGGINPAWRFLDNYLQVTGDYQGVVLLRFYEIYRALVRVKVACIRLQQSGLSTPEKEQHWNDLVLHLDLAFKYTIEQKPVLIITHGLSGSGKTTMSQQLLEQLGAIRISSDVERKRLHGLSAYSSSYAKPGTGIYTDTESAQTYKHIAVTTKYLLEAGLTVIVDAAFLHLSQRKHFRKLASDAGVAFVIFDVQASKANLQARVKQRSIRGRSISEADLKVLDYQFVSAEALIGSELNNRVVITAEGQPDIADIIRQIKLKAVNDALTIPS